MPQDQEFLATHRLLMEKEAEIETLKARIAELEAKLEVNKKPAMEIASPELINSVLDFTQTDTAVEVITADSLATIDGLVKPEKPTKKRGKTAE